VLTTHLMDEAERLADHVAVVDAGRVVAQGTPAELTGGGDTLQFSAAPGLDLSELHAALGDVVKAAEVSPGRYLIDSSDGRPLDPQVIATATSWCATAGVRPDGLSLGRRTLEDVFLDLTGRGLR
jgi:ABC-2 type transport system ATP-binding protein